MSKWRALAEQIHKTSEMAGLGSAESARSPENRLVALVAPLGFPVSEVEGDTAPAAATIAPDEPVRQMAVISPWISAGVSTAARRQRLLAMLERDPEARYAILTADDGKGPVIVAIAIRGAAMAELEIERSRYDGMALLELIEHHGATIH